MNHDVPKRINEYAKLAEVSAKSAKDRLYGATDDELYKDVGIWSIVKNGKAGQIYVDAIKKRGYNALIDDFDRGIMSDAPLIILDAKNDLVKKGEHLVTKDEFMSAFMRIVRAKHVSVADYSTLGDYALRITGESMYERSFGK